MLNDLYQSLDPIAFSFGPISVRWYAIAYIVGFALGALVMFVTARRWRLHFSSDALLTVILCELIGVIVGARLGYVLFYTNGAFLTDPLMVFAIAQGGMSFHGGLIGAIIAGIPAAHFISMPFFSLADLGAIAAPLGLFFGRLANFVNGELWGAPTDWPIGVVFGGTAGTMPRHPSQLYEALLEGVLIFVILFVLSRRKPPLYRGTYFGLFLTLYGSFRFLIEFVREPDIQIGYLLGDWFTMGQLLSLPVIFAGIGVLVYALTKKLPQQGCAETSTYA